MPVPDQAWDVLEAGFHEAAMCRMAAEHRLADVLGALAAAQVPALVVKGPAVAAFYPHPALRSYSDLDLLVPPERLDDARGALAGLGYRPWKGEQPTLEHQFRHLSPMTPTDGRLPVEIHWRLDDPHRVGRLPVDGLWARAVPWSVRGQPALRLDTVDAVLHLCRHAIVQNLGRWLLESLCDVAMLTRDWGRAEWSTLASRAIDDGLGRAVYLLLVLMEKALGVVALREAVDELRSACGGAPPAELVARFLSMDARGATPVSGTTARIWARRTVPGRLVCFLQQLFLPRAVMAAMYDVPVGSRRIWLTYLRRPVDLLKRHGRAAWNTLRGDPSARSAWRQAVWLQRWLEEEP